jgi:hypothetical protein
VLEYKYSGCNYLKNFRQMNFPGHPSIQLSGTLVAGLLTFVSAVDCWKLPVIFYCSRAGCGHPSGNRNNSRDRWTVSSKLHSSTLLDSNSTSSPSSSLSSLSRVKDINFCNDWKSSLPSRDEIHHRVRRMMTKQE